MSDTGVNEKDPQGKNPHEKGAKLDAGKPRMSLVLSNFTRALYQVACVGTYGAAKYTDDGWLEVPNGEERYTDAMLRHLFTEFTGVEKDIDTDLLHAAHVAWNALARLELKLKRRAAERREIEVQNEKRITPKPAGFYSNEEDKYIRI